MIKFIYAIQSILQQIFFEFKSKDKKIKIIRKMEESPNTKCQTDTDNSMAKRKILKKNTKLWVLILIEE